MKKVFLLLFLIVSLVCCYQCNAEKDSKEIQLENQLNKIIFCDFKNANIRDVILGIMKQVGIGFIVNENIDKSSDGSSPYAPKQQDTKKPKKKKKIKITYVRKHVKAEKALQEVLIPNGLDYFKDKKANMVYIGLASEIADKKIKEINTKKRRKEALLNALKDPNKILHEKVVKELKKYEKRKKN